MSDNCQNTNPLKHQGTSQGGRILEALIPENVQLHELSEQEWLQFAYDYARLINYFTPDNPDQSNGDWQSFFEPNDKIEQLLERYGDGDVEPHMALFISFLKLLDFPRQSLNKLPRKHLDYYYEQVLHLEKQPFEADQVHVLFELAQNAVDELVDKDVLLKAGKDAEGNSLNYKTTTSVVVNQAQVDSLKAVYMDEDGILRHAPTVNSADGNGKELEEGQSWSAFGSQSWPEAELSLYVASDLLRLKEGHREIELTFDFESPAILSELKEGHITASVTGEKEWMAASGFKFSATSNTTWVITINEDVDPVVGYDESVHEEPLDTDYPVLKLEITKHKLYSALKEAKITKVTLDAKVEGIESLELQNELGNLDSSKPFMPFGSRPKVGSKLSVVYPEMYGKPISDFYFSMRWLNLPANFTEHYKHYLSEINSQKANYLANINIEQIKWYDTVLWNKNITILEDELAAFPTPEIFQNGNGAKEPVEDTLKDNFKVRVESPYTDGLTAYKLFDDLPQVEITVPEAKNTTAKGEIDLVLTESFYHDLYAELYVNAILAANGGTADLPNEPYTPLLDKLTLGYAASETISFTEESSSRNISSQLFHGHPFGTKPVSDSNPTLLPGYDYKELYIGLKNMKAGSNVSLLIQVAEGSENPLFSSFAEGEGVDWWALEDDHWETIADTDFARDDTNNFLRSGIVELPLPLTANTNHTLLDDGLHWLRVRLEKDNANAVCRFVGVHAQAAQATFNNQGNVTGHIEEGLPAGTISKLVNPRAKLKSVSQPYPSFGGEAAETDDEFYRRVSERLRHKNRAVSIWDYEHLVLQEFPSLYKVKCLNHTYWDGTVPREMEPGNVTLVVIPKVTEGNTEFRLEPKVSQDFKDQVQDFIDPLNSIHADVWIANPIYEPVRFEFDVSFNTGLDYNFYHGETKEDLKKLLAPWVFESDAAIQFGGSYTEYEIVNYLENLDYIDFVENFRMYHKPAGQEEFQKKTVVEPSNPMAILVPASEHDINQAEGCS